MAEQKDRANPAKNIETRGRGGGQGKPKTPSGERKPWKPPATEKTPANRGKPASGE